MTDNRSSSNHQERAIAAVKATIGSLTKTIFTSQDKKQELLEIARAQTLQFPEDPQIWEKFAILLLMQKNPSKAEIIDAYRQAESLYLDREDTENALAIAKIMNGMEL
jgi:hypothetical protein